RNDVAATGGGTIRPALYLCAGAMCSEVSRPDIAGVQYLAVSARFASDRTLALAWDGQVLLSRDAGASFTPLPVPPEASVANIQATSDARGPVVWATIVDGTGATGVSRWDARFGWVPVIPMRNDALRGGL